MLRAITTLLVTITLISTTLYANESTNNSQDNKERPYNGETDREYPGEYTPHHPKPNMAFSGKDKPYNGETDREYPGHYTPHHPKPNLAFSGSELKAVLTTTAISLLVSIVIVKQGVQQGLIYLGGFVLGFNQLETEEAHGSILTDDKLYPIEKICPLLQSEDIEVQDFLDQVPAEILQKCELN